MTDPKLSPHQEMLCELLVARHRLGEPFWPITKNPQNSAALKLLQNQGLVDYQHGHTEGNWDAELTAAGRKEFMPSTYNPPQPTTVFVMRRMARPHRIDEGVFATEEAARAKYPDAHWTYSPNHGEFRSIVWITGDDTNTLVHIDEVPLRG